MTYLLINYEYPPLGAGAATATMALLPVSTASTTSSPTSSAVVILCARSSVGAFPDNPVSLHTAISARCTYKHVQHFEVYVTLPSSQHRP